MAIDPVCKMEVEESKAPATSEYQGRNSIRSHWVNLHGYRAIPSRPRTQSAYCAI